MDPKLHTNFLNKYSFAKVAVILITSIPGLHRNKAMSDVGIAKARKWIQTSPIHQERSNPPSRSAVYALFSSIGKITSEVRKDFEDAFGIARFPSNELKPPCSLRSSAPDSENPHARSAVPNDELKLIWPSVSFVKDCIDGYFAGYELCGDRQRLYAPNVIPNLYEYLSRDEAKKRIPPHIKCYYRINSDDQSIHWALLTSANLSKSSWGTLQKNKTQLFIANYEVGVLFCPWLLEEVYDNRPSPNSDSPDSEKNTTQLHRGNQPPTPVRFFSSKVTGLERLHTHWRVNFPVAFKEPINSFLKNRAQQPWCDDQDFYEQDRNGMIFVNRTVKKREN
ncbi:uncharacterized protein LOC126330796 [Schistocerca gregaria]|uniref:uncharacterized protein LOC126330796 n=1 Tax=Schistocerca gregaria TaxID=7010 RepID=UPI00211E70B8|nr:uncharacterized protein LOC126330796 [Schistocerca gregaria]